MNFLYIFALIFATANAFLLLTYGQYSGALGWSLVAAYNLTLFLET